MLPLRLCDIGPDEQLVIECRCRRVVVFSPPHLKRLRASAETPIMDIIPRFRCKGCNAREGFRVTIERDRSEKSRLAGYEPPIAVIAGPGKDDA